MAARLSPPPQADAHWRQSPLGRHVLRTERTVLAAGLEGIYGSFGLQVGDWPGTRLFPRQGDQLHRCFVVSAAHEGKAGDVRSDPHHLPIATESVDVVVLSHLLEQVPHPHPLLREVDRVLIGEVGSSSSASTPTAAGVCVSDSVARSASCRASSA